MTRAEKLRALAERVEAAERPDWRLDDEVNDVTGQVRVVGHLGLNGRSAGRRRYFGPKSNPFGNGSPVPKPTKTPESRAKAAARLRALAEEEGQADAP